MRRLRPAALWILLFLSCLAFAAASNVELPGLNGDTQRDLLLARDLGGAQEADAGARTSLPSLSQGRFWIATLRLAGDAGLDLRDVQAVAVLLVAIAACLVAAAGTW